MSEPVTKEELHAALEITKVDLHAALEAMETRLLRAFYRWARPAEIHTKQASERIRQHDDILAMVEERLSELERKKIRLRQIITFRDEYAGR